MNFKWSDALFLPEDEVWNKDTKGMVLDPNDVEDDEDEVPKEAKNQAVCLMVFSRRIKARSIFVVKKI